MYFMAADPGKSPDHEAEEMQFQIVRRDFVRCARRGKFRETDHKAGHAHLRSDVNKLRDHTANQVPMFPDGA